VLAELKHPFAPEVWRPQGNLVVAHLDLGEVEAITLATEVHAEVVLIDALRSRRSRSCRVHRLQ
jgi:predicted nucleic acid-binding protein